MGAFRDTGKPIVVIGAGLAGVTTAHELARRGLPTVLVEALDGVALQTSFANGALLTPSMSDPWNAPGVLGHLITSVLDPHAAMKLRLSAIPGLATWGLRFIANASPARFRAATQASYKLSRYSVDHTWTLRRELGLQFPCADTGSLKVFADPAALEASRSTAQHLAPLGLNLEVLDGEGAIAREPALGEIRDRIRGALYFPGDGSGDAHLFCRELADRFRGLGGELRTGFRVAGVEVRGGRVEAVTAPGGEAISASAVVFAGGGQSLRLLSRLGVRLPIRPAKGYTLSFDVAPQGGPSIPVIDDALHAVVVPIGGGFRIAGTAEFAGDDLSIRPERIDNLWRLFETLYPRLASGVDRRDGRPWAGARPMSADGLPLIGPTRIEGLLVNAGHGHLGWTMAVGSARLLANQLLGAAPEIDPVPYRVHR